MTTTCLESGVTGKVVDLKVFLYNGRTYIHTKYYYFMIKGIVVSNCDKST